MDRATAFGADRHLAPARGIVRRLRHLEHVAAGAVDGVERKINLALVIAILIYSEWLGRKIGAAGLNAISKIIAMLLAAIAIAMIRRGLTH